MQTITVSLNTIWQPSESKLLQKLRDNILPSIVDIRSVERTLFSNRYSITVNSSVNNQMLNDMVFAVLKNMGYEPDMLLIEFGNESSKPGGLAGAVESTAKTVSTPLIAIAVVVVVLGAIYFLPKDIIKGD